MCMRQFVIALAAILAVVTIPATAQHTTSTNVTTIVHDNDTTGTELLLRSDDYNSSGQATYISGKGSASVSSTVTNGEWVLMLERQSLRTLWITPNDPVGSEPAGPPAGYYWQSTEGKSICFDQYGNTVPLQNVLTSSGNCKLGVNFNSGGTLYKLLMSPFPLEHPGDSPPTCPSTGCPATGLATVICNKVSSGQCVNWTIVPNTGAANANVANLYWYYAPHGGTVTWVYIGQYYNTFRIDVTNP